MPAALIHAFKVLLKIVMARHLVAFTAFLVKSQPRPFALLEIVLNPHGRRRSDAREAVDHHPDQAPDPATR